MEIERAIEIEEERELEVEIKMKIKISIRCKIKRRGFGAKNGDIYKLLDDVIYCIMTVSDCSNKYDAFEKRGVVTCHY